VLASGFGSIDQVPALLQCRTGGHFDGSMLAILHGAERHGNVPIPRGGNVDDVEFELGQVLEIPFALAEAGGLCLACVREAFLRSRHFFGHQVADRLDLYPLISAQTHSRSVAVSVGTNFETFSSRSLSRPSPKAVNFVIDRKRNNILSKNLAVYDDIVSWNEKRVGERVWEPCRLDVTEYLYPGENRLKIAVTNSDSNRRAVADPIRYLERKLLPEGIAAVYMDLLSLNGLLGPAALVPYKKIELHIPQSAVSDFEAEPNFATIPVQHVDARRSLTRPLEKPPRDCLRPT